MPMWMRKLLVGVVAVLTLGTVVPTGYLHIPNRSSRDDVQEAPAVETVVSLPKTRSDVQEALVSNAIEQAKAQGKKKFGKVIDAKIGQQYEQTVVPKFAKAVATMADQLSFNELQDVVISQNPSPGLGERIIHLYDLNSKESYLKLHVRRDHPPLDGYYFNFHYHTTKDAFTGHHDITKIYWDKNTPPHWQA